MTTVKVNVMYAPGPIATPTGIRAGYPIAVLKVGGGSRGWMWRVGTEWELEWLFYARGDAQGVHFGQNADRIYKVDPTQYD